MTPNEYRRDVPLSKDQEYVLVYLGPINRALVTEKEYLFPTREAAERFADGAHERHPDREITIVQGNYRRIWA